MELDRTYRGPRAIIAEEGTVKEKKSLCSCSEMPVSGTMTWLCLGHVMRNLSKRISSLSNRIESMSLTHLGERLYQVLRNMALEHGVRSQDGFVIEFPLTHEDLAFLVGAHRVSVTRALKELKRTGSIFQQKRHLVVRSD